MNPIPTWLSQLTTLSGGDFLEAVQQAVKRYHGLQDVDQDSITGDQRFDERGAVREEHLDEWYDRARQEEERINAMRESSKARKDALHGGQEPETRETQEVNELTKEQREKLDELYSMEYYGFLIYPREEAVIKGQAEEDFERFSLEEIQMLAENAGSGKELYDRVIARHKYPDTASGPLFNGNDREYFGLQDQWTLEVSISRNSFRDTYRFICYNSAILADPGAQPIELYSDIR